jgi:hypothetical protein
MEEAHAFCVCLAPSSPPLHLETEWERWLTKIRRQQKFMELVHYISFMPTEIDLNLLSRPEYMMYNRTRKSKVWIYS